MRFKAIGNKADNVIGVVRNNDPVPRELEHRIEAGSPNRRGKSRQLTELEVGDDRERATRRRPTRWVFGRAIGCGLESVNALAKRAARRSIWPILVRD